VKPALVHHVAQRSAAAWPLVARAQQPPMPVIDISASARRLGTCSACSSSRHRARSWTDLTNQPAGRDLLAPKRRCAMSAFTAAVRGIADVERA